MESARQDRKAAAGVRGGGGVLAHPATGGVARSSRARAPRATPVSGQALAALAGLVAALALAGCDPYLEGNGVYLEEDRSASLRAFAGLDAEDRLEVTITAGATVQSVVVSADANLVPNIVTEVRTIAVGTEDVDVLHVRFDAPGGGYDATIPLRAVIQVPTVRYLAGRDEAAILLRDAAADDLTLDARSRSHITVRGPGGTSLHATVDAATVDAGSYAVAYADLELRSCSPAPAVIDVELNASGTVTGTADEACVVNNLLAAGAVCDVSGIACCQQVCP